MEADLTPTKKTADRLLESMNSLMSFLRLTQEIGEDFPDQKLRSGLRSTESFSHFPPNL